MNKNTVSFQWLKLNFVHNEYEINAAKTWNKNGVGRQTELETYKAFSVAETDKAIAEAVHLTKARSQSQERSPQTAQPYTWIKILK